MFGLTGKDFFESGITLLLFLTFCVLVIYGLKIPGEFIAMLTYVGKKFFDGVAESRKSSKKSKEE